MTPRSLLNGARGLAQVGRVREGADGQVGLHRLGVQGVQKAPLLLKFDHKFCPEDLTLIELKTAASNGTARINLNSTALSFREHINQRRQSQGNPRKFYRILETRF
jgi:hypothetical protein